MNEFNRLVMANKVGIPKATLLPLLVGLDGQDAALAPHLHARGDFFDYPSKDEKYSKWKPINQTGVLGHSTCKSSQKLEQNTSTARIFRLDSR